MKKEKDSQFEDLKKSIQRKCSKTKENNLKRITLMLDASKNKPPMV